MEKKILGAVTVCFFIIMIIFTFVSRTTAIELLPEVSWQYPTDEGALPKEAVMLDSGGKEYVIALFEEESILGEVTVTKKMPVTVIEEREDETVLEELKTMSTFRFVTFSERELIDGERVRAS